MKKRKTSSQESRVTSTPISMSPPVSSPDLSSITDYGVPMEIDSETEESDTESKQSQQTFEDLASSFNESAVSENSVKRLREAKNIKWTGFWSSLKPKNRDSLFYKIVAHPEEIEAIVTDLFKIYNRNKKSVVLLILQLFVDLCGYKKLTIDKVYEFEKTNAKDVIESMESELMETELRVSGKFLFMKCSKFESTLSYIVAEFIKQLLIKSCNTKILFDDFLPGHLFEFLNCMCVSQLRNIRITGAVLVYKFLTAVVNVYSWFLQCTEDENGNITENMEDHKSSLESYIDFLYLICHKACLVPDRKCFPLKVKYLQEMCYWIKAFPPLFILEKKCIERLIKMISDPMEVVRKTALTTCVKLINSETVRNALSEKIDLCLKYVSPRFTDVNSEVAIQAVNVFTAAARHFPDKITEGQKKKIIYRMFEQNLTVAKAAGEFLAAYLCQRNDDAEQIMMSLVKISLSEEQFPGLISLFVQSCIEFIPELKNWNVVMKILLNDKVDLEIRKQLIYIFKETVEYTLTGKFSIARPVPLHDSLDENDHRNIARTLIPNFENLLTLFQTDKKILRRLTESLTFLNYELCRSLNFDLHYVLIFDILKRIFISSTDQILLENIAVIFSLVSGNNYYKRAKSGLKSLINNYVEIFDESMKQLSPKPDKNLLMRLRETSMKISILFAKFNLTDILKWEDIFQSWDNHFKALKYLLVCCKWHLTWSLRQFIRNALEENNTGRINHLLYSNCKDFVYGCLDMLKSADGNSDSFLIFETLCDLYANFEMEMKRKRQFSNLIVPIDEPAHVEVLFNFVTRFVIHNTQLPLEERQKYLSKIVDVMYLCVIPTEHFSKILKFYNSHYAQFGNILDHILHQLTVGQPSLPLLIMHTLAEMYTQILAKYRVDNLRTDESRQLKLLVRKFSQFKEMKSSDVLKLVTMSIHFAFQSEKNYCFFYYTKTFAKILNENGKTEARHLFGELIPEKDKNSVILLLFEEVLKRK